MISVRAAEQSSRACLIQDNDTLGNEVASDTGGDLKLQEPSHAACFHGRELHAAIRWNGTDELHLPDGGEVINLAGFTGGNAGSLSRGFGQDDTGHEWIAGEMAAEKGLGPGKGLRATGGLAGIDLDNGIDEDEWIAMRQTAFNRIKRGHSQADVS